MKPLESIRPGRTAAAVALAAGLAAASANAENTLNVASGGSQNMVDYVTDYLGPLFEEQNPGWKVRVVGTGPGDAGSQKIKEKLEAQADNDAWDTDVIATNQKKTGEMVEAGLLSQYRSEISTGALVTRDTAEMALGTDVGGYVMPMFHSQTALAYFPELVSDPPGTYDELRAWVEAHPKQFGYNGIKNGMSGVAFVVGWVYTYGGNTDQIINGPYDPALKDTWDGALGDLKAFNEHITFTPGNAGTLDMLNRGEIVMGPVWVDMFYTWQADGRVPPNMKLLVLGPGMPGQPYYYAIPAKAANRDAANEVHRARDEPHGSGRGHRQPLQLVPGDRRGARPGLARSGGVGEDLQRRDPRGPRREGPAVPARPVLRGHQGSLRAEGHELGSFPADAFRRLSGNVAVLNAQGKRATRLPMPHSPRSSAA